MPKGYRIIHEDGQEVDISKDSTSQEIKDTIGQESGSTVLSRLLDIWNKLVELFSNGTGSVQIKDGTGGGYKAKVDEANRILVSSVAIPPESTTPVHITAYGNVVTTSDTFYVIPNGETIRLQKFSAGAEVDSTAGTVIELWYDPDGDIGVNIELIDVIFASGNTDQHDLLESYLGDGIGRVVIRRKRLTGGAKEVFGSWEGYF